MGAGHQTWLLGRVASALTAKPSLRPSQPCFCDSIKSLMVLLGSFQRVMAVSKNSAQGWGSFVPGMPASLMLALAFSMCVCVE